jgi:hypothetical protein
MALGISMSYFCFSRKAEVGWILVTVPGRVLPAAIAFAFMIVMSGCGGGNSTDTGSEQAATKNHHPHQQRLKPARMLPPDSSPYGEAIIGPVRNGWVAEGRTTTIVYAGGQGYSHPEQGKFLIHRDGFGPRTDSIYVDRAGAIKITKAPLGRKALGPAQRHGEIEFTSSNGVSGTLHLKDDTVTLNR